MALHRLLCEIDQFGRKEPQLRALLQQNELDLIIDSLALLEVRLLPSHLQQLVALRIVPAIPILAECGVKRPEKSGVWIGVSRRGVHGGVEQFGLPILDPYGILHVTDRDVEAHTLE